MQFGAVYNVYNNRMIFGASQKTEEKQNNACAKMIDDIPLMRYKIDKGIKYIVKLSYEKEARQISLLKSENDCVFILISLPGCNIDLCQDGQNYFVIGLKKDENNYKSYNKPYYELGLGAGRPDVKKEDKKILKSVLNPILKGEADPEYKKILSAAIEALK